MDDGRVCLDQLNSRSHDYKVKVKVMQKWKPLRGASGVLYQNVLLQDDKGNKMRGTLFGDEIGAHIDALVYNGVYEIANAPIRAAQPQYRRDPTELAYTMGFGGQALIRPLTLVPGPFLPDYQCASQIPKTATPYDTFDVIGALLYVEPVAREVPAKQGRKNSVREIILTDNSSEQPLVVSVWNDLAEDDCGKLASLVGNFPVVGFTALKVSTHRGFSLASTMSTSINTTPTGDKVVTLTEWVTRNKELLPELQARIRGLRDPNAPIHVITLSALKNKRAKNTLQDERYRLKVVVPSPSLQKVNAYLGCSHCGKLTSYVAGESFNCETCNREGVVCEPRITFNCDVSDGTEQLEITAFTENTVKLFRMPAPDIFHMKHSEDHQAFQAIQALLKDEPFIVEVSPKTALTRNNTLQWALRSVIPPSPEQPLSSLPLPQATSPEHDVTVDALQSASVARRLDFGPPPKEPCNPGLVDVSISADYPTPRKLPPSITAIPTNDRVQNAIPEEAVVPAQTNNQATTLAPTLPDPDPHREIPGIVTKTTIGAVNKPMLTTPMVGISPTYTPETPAQGTPKRNTSKQGTGSPSKKKKTSNSLSLGN